MPGCTFRDTTWMTNPLAGNLFRVLRQKPGFPNATKSPRGNMTLEKSSVIGLVSGSHTYFLAASSHEEVSRVLPG